jgi:hypothetical protein
MGMIAAIGVAGTVVVTVCALAESNPYEAIANRNIFSLKDPVQPPVVAPDSPAPADNSQLMLTGIVDFHRLKRALITCTERGKPPQFYTLSVGEKEDNLQILAVDAEGGTVRVLHGSAEVLLSFDTHGPPNAARLEEQSRKYVQQAKPFVDEHARAHELREKREAQRREIERAAAEAELISRRISTHMDEPRL